MQLALWQWLVLVCSSLVIAFLAWLLWSVNLFTEVEGYEQEPYQ